MKCIFVNLINYDNPEKEIAPIGLLSLATIVDNNMDNVSAEVLDLNYLYSNDVLKLSNDLDVNIAETVEYIMNLKPDFVSLYTMCNNHHFALLIAKEIKMRSPGIVICFGGPHATITAEDTLKKYDYVDFIGLGEGELTIEGIIDGVRNNNLTNIKGIAYLGENGVVLNVNDMLVEDLDSLPYINYELLNFKVKDKISIDVGRGCPFSCKFCSTKGFWKRNFRIKSPKRIFEEIKRLVNDYGIKRFSFEHDLFVLNKEVVLELCELIINSELKIEWGCSSRLDTIDEDLLERMSLAGCYAIYFGIETGSQRMQKEINKNLKLDKIWELVTSLKKYKIEPTFSFIFGFPNEHQEDIELTLNMHYKLYEMYRHNYYNRSALLQLHKLFFLPGTELFYENKHLLIKSDNPRLEIQKGLNHWNHDYLTNMVHDISIFPQFFELKTELSNKTEVLDMFFGNLFPYFIEYLDVTYKTLLNHFKSNYKLYLCFIESVGKDVLFNTLAQLHGTVYDSVEKSIFLFYDFIMNEKFGENDRLIKDIFLFEFNVFILRHKNEEYKKEIKFCYDVINFKKTRGSEVKEVSNSIIFKNASGEKVIIRNLN